MDEAGGVWPEQLPTALWAYRTSKRRPTQATPYALVYGSEAVLPVEILVPSVRMALSAHLIPDARVVDLEALDEKRDKAAVNLEKYQRARVYDQSVVKREFEVGDLVWKTIDAIMRGQPIPKFAPKWEGPYEVVESNFSGYYKLALRNFIRLLHSLTFPLGLMRFVFSIDIPRLRFLHQLLHVLPEMDLLKFLHQVGLTN